MHTKCNRRTACAFRAKFVLGWLAAIVIPLSLFSDTHHPIFPPHPSVALSIQPTAIEPEKPTPPRNIDSFHPDLDVDFRDVEFGSHIPTDNGAAEYFRQRREPYEYPSSATKGGPKVSLKPSDAKVLSLSSRSDQDNPPQNVKVMFSVTR